MNLKKIMNLKRIQNKVLYNAQFAQYVCNLMQINYSKIELFE